MGDLALIEYDIAFANGDFVLTNDQEGNQTTILCLATSKGEWRENPTIGVGVDAYLVGELTEFDLSSEIRKQLESDGKKVESVIFKNGVLTVKVT